MMNSTEAIRNYKHDIAGKFKDISTALNSLDENSFDDAENNEIFHAVHEVILKMVKTSRNTIAQKLNQEILLVVTNDLPDNQLPKLQIEGVTVRYTGDKSSIKYVYSKTENEGSLDVHIGVLKTLLPIKSVEYEGQAVIVTKFLKENREEV
jgi:hypothetical protein